MASASSKDKFDQPSRASASASAYSKDKIDGLTNFNAFSNRVAASEIDLDWRLSTYPRVLFEGYDQSLPKNSIKFAVSQHFQSCGQIYFIDVDIDPLTPDRLMRNGYIYFVEESAQKMAVTLSTTDVKGGLEGEGGGWRVYVKDSQKKECASSPEQVAAARRLLFSSQCGFVVTGYDTSLPADLVRKSLFEHFSSCGEIIYLTLEEYPSQPGLLKSSGFIHLLGDGALDKAVKLSGSDLGGWKVLVKTLPEPITMELSGLGFEDSFDSDDSDDDGTNGYGFYGQVESTPQQ